MSERQSLIPVERIDRAIILIRGQKVMLDKDLAALYGVATKTLNRAVQRNLDRFPEDFMFQLAAEEFDSLRYQSGTLKDETATDTTPTGRGRGESDGVRPAVPITTRSILVSG